MPLDLALWLPLISSNYPCLEYIFMVRKVFEPLKFYCILCSGAPVAQWVKRWPTDLAVLSLIPARGKIFSTVNEIPLHTAFHYHPPIVLIWLEYCWKGRKDRKSSIHPSIYLFCAHPPGTKLSRADMQISHSSLHFSFFMPSMHTPKQWCARQHRCKVMTWAKPCIDVNKASYLHSWCPFQKPYSETVKRNVVFIQIITLSHATSHGFAWHQNMPWLSTNWLNVGGVVTSLTLFRC